MALMLLFLASNCIPHKPACSILAPIIYIYVYMYACIHVCMHVHVCIYIYIYIQTTHIYRYIKIYGSIYTYVLSARKHHYTHQTRIIQQKRYDTPSGKAEKSQGSGLAPRRRPVSDSHFGQAQKSHGGERLFRAPKGPRCPNVP